MTDTPTQAPTDSAVEPAGVYKPIKDIADLEDRLALWCQIREPSRLVKHGSVLEMLTASRDAVRKLSAARQQLAEMRGALQEAINLRIGLYRNHEDHGKYKPAAEVIAEDKWLSRWNAALAPTSQPERGKCETTWDVLIATADNFKLPIDVKIGAGTFTKGVKVGTAIRCLKNHAGYASEIPDSEYPTLGVAFTDCAQPERQASPALREPERVLTQQERDGLHRAHRRSVVTVDPPPISPALREAAKAERELALTWLRHRKIWGCVHKSKPDCDCYSCKEFSRAIVLLESLAEGV